MATFNRKNIMATAWTLAKQGQKVFGGKVSEYFSAALLIAWSQAKNEATNISGLVALLSSHTKRCNQRYSAALQTAFDSWSESNQGLIPTIDYKGKLHAPSNGFEVDGEIYVKGQFIPHCIHGDDSFYGGCFPRKIYSDRIKATGDALEEMKTLIASKIKLDGVSLSTGKEFSSKGENIAYVYIDASTIGFLNIAKDYITAINKAYIDKAAASKPAPIKGTAPTGRVTVKGTILGMPVLEDYYGTQYKMMVELENGATVYGTQPKSTYDAAIGDKIEFTGTFDHAVKDGITDPTHAFFKRPAKASVAA